MSALEQPSKLGRHASAGEHLLKHGSEQVIRVDILERVATLALRRSDELLLRATLVVDGSLLLVAERHISLTNFLEGFLSYGKVWILVRVYFKTFLLVGFLNFTFLSRFFNPKYLIVVFGL